MKTQNSNRSFKMRAPNQSKKLNKMKGQESKKPIRKYFSQKTQPTKKSTFTIRESYKRRFYEVDKKGAICLKNLPHGFYEYTIYHFLRQFGDITRYRVVRSNKNANPMGYAYIEFEYEKVAKVAAKTMNNYLIFDKILKCRFINVNNIKEKMFAPTIVPELCNGTKKKLRNQYMMEHGDEASLKAKLLKRTLSHLGKLSKALGLKVKKDAIPATLSPPDQEIKAGQGTSDSSSEQIQEIVDDETRAVEEGVEDTLNCSVMKSPKLLKSKKKIRRENSVERANNGKGRMLGESNREKVKETPKGKRKRPLSDTEGTPIIMEIDEVDEEIYVKTPPNVIKVIKKGVQRVICDEEATTQKKASKKVKLGPLNDVASKLFNKANNLPTMAKKQRKRRKVNVSLTEESADSKKGKLFNSGNSVSVVKSKVRARNVKTSNRAKKVQSLSLDSCVKSQTDGSLNEEKRKHFNKANKLASVTRKSRSIRKANVSLREASADTKKEKLFNSEHSVSVVKSKVRAMTVKTSDDTKKVQSISRDSDVRSQTGSSLKGNKRKAKTALKSRPVPVQKNKAKKRKENDIASALTKERCVNVSEKSAAAGIASKKKKEI